MNEDPPLFCHYFLDHPEADRSVFCNQDVRAESAGDFNADGVGAGLHHHLYARADTARRIGSSNGMVAGAHCGNAPVKLFRRQGQHVINCAPDLERTGTLQQFQFQKQFRFRPEPGADRIPLPMEGWCYPGIRFQPFGS